MISLCIILFIFLIFAYFLNKREMVAPGVIFASSFLLAAFFALINVKRWSLSLDHRTFLVISLGVLEFILISYAVSLIRIKNQRSTSISSNSSLDDSILYIKKKSPFLYIIIIIEIINVWMLIKYVRNATGMSDLSVAMNYLREQSLLENNSVPRMSWLVSFGSNFNMSVGLFFEYVLSKAFFDKKIFSWQILVITILGVLTPLLNSTRGVSIYLIIAFIIDIYFAGKKYNDHSNLKYGIIAFFVIIIVLSLLQWSASFLGRDVDNFTPFDYVSNYIGAQIKNLDTFIRTITFPVKEDIFGKQTFYALMPTISKILGLNMEAYKLDLPFQIANGNSLGNVYTTFYPWLYDFGYIGVVVMTAIMAVISQLIFNVAKSKKQESISIFQIIYSYIGSFIGLSFFSNKFFENLNTNFIYTILICYLLKKLFTKRYIFSKSFKYYL